MRRTKLLVLLALILVGLMALTPALAEVVRIGIVQFAEHPSLDNCRTGLIEGLRENGFAEGDNLEIRYQNAQADTGTTALIAADFASTCDMIVAIATPAAAASFNAAEGKIPVVYTAVTDPIAVGLANPDGTSTGDVTGTSDSLPVEAQLAMIRAMQPDAKRIGILHTTSETNSDSSLARYRELAPKYSFDIVDQGIATGADVPMAMDALLPKVDCLTNLTDNTVVSYLPVILEMASEAGKPVYGSEIEQVIAGCVASEGLEYVSLGRQTGAIAARILKGEQASAIPFETITESQLSINTDAMAQFGLVLPDSLKDRATDARKD